MKRRKAQRRSDIQQRTDRRCAFCNRDIPDNHEVFGFGAKGSPGANLEQHMGRIIEISVATLDRKIPVVVVGADSPARLAGHDLYFMTCSESCARELKAAVEQDVKLGSALLG